MPDLGVAGVAVVASTWLMTYLLHSAVVVAVVWLLARSGWVRRPTTLDLLWKVALVAALGTASVAVLRPARVVSRQVAVEVKRTLPGGSVAWTGRGPERGALVRVEATAMAPSPACREAMRGLGVDPPVAALTLREVCRPPVGLGWRGLLVVIWLLGAAVLVTQALVVRRGLRRALHDAHPADARLIRAARGLLPGSRPPLEVLVSPSLDAPCVIGGRVVLPQRCVRCLTPDQIHAVLAHEVAHVARRDPSWIGLGDLLCRALWLQPLNRLALEGLRESAELVCDDWAVDRTRRPLELARSIATVAEWIHPGGRAPAPALAHLAHLAHGEGRVLSTRVRRILTQGAARRAAPRWLRLLLAALVVAPTLAVPAVPRAAAVFAVFVREETELEGPPTVPATGAEDVLVLVGRTPTTG